MAIQLSEDHVKLLHDKSIASIATIGDDGAPQVTPVWIDWDGQYVLFNTEQKRAKVRHLKANPRVAIAVFDPGNPYRYIEIRGRVVEVTEQGANDDIDRLAKKYTGMEKYPWNRPGDVRVIVKVEPIKVLGMMN